MSNKTISEEDVAKLSENPNVESITPRCIVFTPEFKQKAYEKLCAGMKMGDILLQEGIDPMALGKIRVRGLQEKIEKFSKRPDGFANLRKTRSTASNAPKDETLQKQIRQLQQELAYTRQEVEFLKKIRMADLEARRSWESKHPQE